MLLVLAGVVVGARWASGNTADGGTAVAVMGRMDGADASLPTSESTGAATPTAANAVPPTAATTTTLPGSNVDPRLTVTRVPITAATSSTTTTTTTAPTTTTTAPTTTTSTTTTSTSTTTTLPEIRGLFVERFSAKPLGDDASWEVRLEIELGATADGPQRAQVSPHHTGRGSRDVIEPS